MMRSILESSKNKKGLSAMIAYILLISMAISLSAMIYSWLKFYVDVDEVEQCPEGVSLEISSYDCNKFDQKITVTVKNRGRWTVNGFNLRAHDRPDAIQGLYNLNPVGFELVNISPGQSYTKTYDFPMKTELRQVEDITIIELQPFMIFDNAINKSFCKPITTQSVTCEVSACTFGEYDYNGVCLPGLIHYWPFNSDFNDAVGGADGSAEDGASIVDSALSLDGDLDRVNLVSENIDFGTNDVSISFWMKTNEAWDGIYDILGRYTTGTPTTREGVWFTSTAANTFIFRSGTVGISFVQITNTDGVDDGNWHHIVGTIDRTGDMSLYVDGGSPQTSSFSAHELGDLGTFDYIGDGNGGGGYNYHNGSIDEVMIFDEVLTQEDVDALYALGRA